MTNTIFGVIIIISIKQPSMRGISLLIFASILFLGVSSRSNSVPEQLKDYEVFKNVLLEKEGRLDLYSPMNSIMESLTELERELSQERTLLEQFKAYGRTLSKIQCGHTQIHPNKATLREWLSQRNSLPLDFYLQGKKLFVSKLLSSDYPLIHQRKTSRERRKKIKENSEIISIDNQTIPEIMQEIAPFLSSDQDAIDFKYFQIAQLFDFYRHMSHPFTKDSIRVVYTRGRDTSEIYFQTGMAPVNTMNDRLKKAGEEFDKSTEDIGKFKIERSRYAYFRFKSFKACHGKKYETFLRESFKKIKQRKVKRMIVDLRGNTGGVMQYSFMRYIVGHDVLLGRYVVEKPKRGIENRNIKKIDTDYFKHKRLSRRQRRMIRKGKFENGEIRTPPVEEDLIFSGEIVVITDEGTFSAASMLTCHLKTLAEAKIVGRPPGGSFFRGNAGTLNVKLPKSGFKLFVNPNTFYSHLKESDRSKHLKEPDVLLTPRYLKPKKIDTYYLRAAISAFK